MPCEQWHGLLERYRRAARIYAKAVDCLNSANFNQHWRSSELALKNCRSARTILMEHEHEHACASGNWEKMEELVLGDQGQCGGQRGSVDKGHRPLPCSIARVVFASLLMMGQLGARSGGSGVGDIVVGVVDQVGVRPWFEHGLTDLPVIAETFRL